MATRIQRELRYDAPIEQVAAMLLDPAYRDHLCVEQLVTSHTVSVTETAGGAKVTVEQVQEVRGVPSVVAKLIGSQITIRTEEDWSGHDAKVHLTIPGKPATIDGTSRLVADGSGTRQVIDWEVEVKVALVGRKVESVVADVLGHALDVEQVAGAAWLAK